MYARTGKRIPAVVVNHHVVFKETETTGLKFSEKKCIWWHESGYWIIGFCKRVGSNLGFYYQFSDSFECPGSQGFGEDTWLEGETNKPIGGQLIDENEDEKYLKVASGGIPTGEVFLTYFATNVRYMSFGQLVECRNWC